MANVRDSVKSENPNAGITEITSTVANKWRNMTEEEKAPYMAMQAADKVRYQTAMEMLTEEDKARIVAHKERRTRERNEEREYNFNLERETQARHAARSLKGL